MINWLSKISAAKSLINQDSTALMVWFYNQDKIRFWSGRPVLNLHAGSIFLNKKKGLLAKSRPYREPNIGQPWA